MESNPTERPWWGSALATRLQTGFAFNALGTAFNQGSTFVVNLVVANLVGRERFGEYTMIIATVTTVASLGQLSMGYTATKHLAEYRLTDPRKASRILTLCAAVAAGAAALASFALLFGADALARRALGAPELAFALQLAALAVFAAILNGFLMGALAGLESYRTLARTGVAVGTLYTILCSALAWAFGLSGAVLGVALTGLFQSGLLAWAVAREARRAGLVLTVSEAWRERRLIGHFALPASLTGLVALPAIWASSALLARQPGGFDQLALFGAANNFRVMVLFVPQAINNVSMSILNNQLRSSAADYRRVFWMNTRFTAAAALGVAAAVLLAAPMLLQLFGAEFVTGRTVLSILLGAAVLEAIGIAVYQIVVSNSRLWSSLLTIAIPRDTTLVAATALLAPAMGATGLATAHVVAWMVGLTGTILLARRLGLRTRTDVGGVSAA